MCEDVKIWEIILLLLHNICSVVCLLLKCYKCCFQAHNLHHKLTLTILTLYICLFLLFIIVVLLLRLRLKGPHKRSFSNEPKYFIIISFSFQCLSECLMPNNNICHLMCSGIFTFFFHSFINSLAIIITIITYYHIQLHIIQYCMIDYYNDCC